MRIFQVRGVDVHINPFFLLFLLMYASVGLLFETLFAFWVVILHELAHIIVARKLGWKVKKLEILPFGGVIEFDTVFCEIPEKEIAIALAGPVHNFFFAGLVFVLMNNQSLPIKFGRFIIELNLAMGLFNLLPAIPLDGGRIARALLNYSIGADKATTVAISIGKIIGVIIMIIGVYLVVIGKGNIFLPVLGGFLIFAAIKEHKRMPYIHIQHCLRKKEKLIKDGILNAEIIVTHNKMTLIEILKKFSPGKLNIIVILNDDLFILGITTEATILQGMGRHGPGASIHSIIR